MPDGTPRVVIVRHGPTEWSDRGRHTSVTDLPLTEAGRRLTTSLRERLAGFSFSRVLTSPRRRAVETCRVAGFADRAEICDDLVEWDYGVYEGRTTADIHRDAPGWDLWRDGAPGGESPIEVRRRVDRVVDRLEALVDGGDVLVFGHGHALTALTVRWLDLDIVHGRRLDLGPASVSTLGRKRDVRVLDLWNDRAHLTPPA